ncbi:MAG: hypothetical protein AAGF72_02290 [Pseudomonadota bacterium]
MKTRILLIGLLALSNADAQQPPCRNDMTGIQTTRNISDRNGNPYHISNQSRDARGTLHFLHAAVNYLYFSPQGNDLRGEFTRYLRVRDTPILLPACNSRGQCAEIQVSSRPLHWGGFVGLSVHMGFDVSARYNGSMATDFIPVDSSVHWNRIPTPSDPTHRCLSNGETDGSGEPDASDGDDADGNDDSPFDAIWDEIPEPDPVDYPWGEAEIIDPDEEGRFPDEL